VGGFALERALPASLCTRDLLFTDGRQCAHAAGDLTPKLVNSEDAKRLVDFDWDVVNRNQRAWSAASTGKSPDERLGGPGTGRAGDIVAAGGVRGSACGRRTACVQADSDPFAPLFVAPSAEQFRMIFEDNFYFFHRSKNACAGRRRFAPSPRSWPTRWRLWIVSMPPRWRPLAMSGVLVPLLINVVVRSLGIELLLAPEWSGQ
jgi:hypothetical protein